MFRFKDDWARLWAIMIVMLSIVILGGMYFYNQKIYKLIEAGYTQKTLVGADYPRWVKE